MLSPCKPVTFPLLPALVHSSPNMQGLFWAKRPHSLPTRSTHVQSSIFPNVPGLLGQAKASRAWVPPVWSGGQSHSELPCVDGLQRRPRGFCSSEAPSCSDCLFLAQCLAPRFQVKFWNRVSSTKAIVESYCIDSACKTPNLLSWSDATVTGTFLLSHFTEH